MHHLGCLKPYKQWDKPPINWCEIIQKVKNDGFAVPHVRKQRSKTADPPGNSQFLSPGPMAVGAITAHAVATGGKKKTYAAVNRKGL